MAAHIVLVDDNKATNYIHEKFIKKVNTNIAVNSFQMGVNALKHLKTEGAKNPYLLFIDINMPTMDAWEFLENFKTLAPIVQKNGKIYLLTTSLKPSDKNKLVNFNFVKEIIAKPLNETVLKRLLHEA